MQQNSFSLVALSITTSATGQNTSDFCPADVDAVCVEALTAHVISARQEETQRQALALDYAAILFPKTPGHASRLVEEFSESASWRSLRRIADRFADADLIWAAIEARASDPNPRFKVLDTSLMVEDAAEIGHLNLAHRIHSAIAPHLPGELAGFVPLSDELRLTRLMAFYGWPEDEPPILEAVYPKLQQMRQDSWAFGFTLTNLVTVLILSGHHALHQQLEADISAFPIHANPQVQNDVRKAHVTSLAEAGHIEEATVKASEYELNFDQAIQNTPHLFLTHESEHFPDIADDALRRFEVMLATVKSPVLKADFLAILARRMIQDKQYDGLDGLLARVADQTLRAGLVGQLMIYHAREREDALPVAELYFTAQPEFVAQYPLSLTARGLLKAGDLERGDELADIVLEHWLKDEIGRRRFDALLVGALAVVGDDERIAEWYAASDDPAHKMDVRIAALRAQVNSGQFGNIATVQAELNGMLLLFSDTERDEPIFWPADRPYSTLRGEAAEKLRQLDEDIIIALARSDQNLFRHSSCSMQWIQVPLILGVPISRLLKRPSGQVTALRHPSSSERYSTKFCKETLMPDSCLCRECHAPLNVLLSSYLTSSVN